MKNDDNERLLSKKNLTILGNYKSWKSMRYVGP